MSVEAPRGAHQAPTTRQEVTGDHNLVRITRLSEDHTIFISMAEDHQEPQPSRGVFLKTYDSQADPANLEMPATSKIDKMKINAAVSKITAYLTRPALISTPYDQSEIVKKYDPVTNNLAPDTAPTDNNRAGVSKTQPTPPPEERIRIGKQTLREVLEEIHPDSAAPEPTPIDSHRVSKPSSLPTRAPQPIRRTG